MQTHTQELKNFEFGNATDAGCVRPNNEDYLGYFQTQNGICLWFVMVWADTTQAKKPHNLA